jgi:hypothetical protein
VAGDGSGDFTTIEDACDSLTNTFPAPIAEQRQIFVRNGDYRPTRTIDVPVWTAIEGDAGVVIYDDQLPPGSVVMRVTGKGIPGGAVFNHVDKVGIFLSGNASVAFSIAGGNTEFSRCGVAGWMGSAPGTGFEVVSSPGPSNWNDGISFNDCSAITIEYGFRFQPTALYGNISINNWYSNGNSIAGIDIRGTIPNIWGTHFRISNAVSLEDVQFIYSDMNVILENAQVRDSLGVVLLSSIYLTSAGSSTDVAISVNNIQLDGSNSGFGLFVQTPFNSDFSNISINGYSRGVNVANAQFSSFSNIGVFQCPTFGVSFFGVNCSVSNVRCIATSGSGFIITASRDCTFSGIVCDSCGVGIDVSGNSVQNAINCCHARNSTAQNLLIGVGSDDNEICGNYFDQIANPGKVVDGGINNGHGSGPVIAIPLCNH